MCKLCGKSTCGLSVCCAVSVLTHYGNAGVCSRLHLGFVRCDGNSGRAPRHPAGQEQLQLPLSQHTAAPAEAGTDTPRLKTDLSELGRG